MLLSKCKVWTFYFSKTNPLKSCSEGLRQNSKPTWGWDFVLSWNRRQSVDFISELLFFITIHLLILVHNDTNNYNVHIIRTGLRTGRGIGCQWHGCFQYHPLPSLDPPPSCPNLLHMSSLPAPISSLFLPCPSLQHKEPWAASYHASLRNPFYFSSYQRAVISPVPFPVKYVIINRLCVDGGEEMHKAKCWALKWLGQPIFHTLQDLECAVTLSTPRGTRSHQHGTDTDGASCACLSGEQAMKSKVVFLLCCMEPGHGVTAQDERQETHVPIFHPAGKLPVMR